MTPNEDKYKNNDLNCIDNIKHEFRLLDRGIVSPATDLSSIRGYVETRDNQFNQTSAELTDNYAHYMRGLGMDD